MNNNFKLYSSYYDLLYKDKNYADEVAYIHSLISTHATQSLSSLLELGCGTGVHAAMFAKDGVSVLGVDLSSEMISKARLRVKNSPIDESKIDFEVGDARIFRSERKFDVVCSLFHVASYQTTDDDLIAFFDTASIHLKNNGLFIFDFWYGPAVLWQKPGIRVKRFTDENLKVIRVAEPVIHENLNVVDVNYSVFVSGVSDDNIFLVNETHKMRYFFLPELDRLLQLNGFEMVATHEWLTNNTPSIDSWGVCVVAKKTSHI